MGHAKLIGTRSAQRLADERGLYRLHTNSCIEKYGRADRESKDCRCMIHFEGQIGEHFVRKSTKTRSWSAAVKLLKEARYRGVWDVIEEVEQEQPQKQVPQQISLRVKEYLVHVASRKGHNLSDPTTSKYRTLLNRLVTFCEQLGYTSLDDLSFSVLNEFKASWPIHAVDAIRNNITRLRRFFRYAVKSGWCKQNTALDLDMPSEEMIERLPFTPEEEQRIYRTALTMNLDCQQEITNTELETFCHLMRNTGMSMADAALFQTSELVGDEVRYYRKKTKRSVRRKLIVIPIETWLIDRIKSLPVHHGSYYFCHGSRNLRTATDVWQNRLSQLFQAAEIEGGTSHRFRHTFATFALENGIPIDIVSQWLGHASVKTTERYYAHATDARTKKSSDWLRQLHADLAARKLA